MKYRDNFKPSDRVKYNRPDLLGKDDLKPKGTIQPDTPNGLSETGNYSLIEWDISNSVWQSYGCYEASRTGENRHEP